MEVMAGSTAQAESIKHAILLYETFATVHDVELKGGKQPVIKPGTLQQFFWHFGMGLGNRVGQQALDAAETLGKGDEFEPAEHAHGVIVRQHHVLDRFVGDGADACDQVLRHRGRGKEGGKDQGAHGQAPVRVAAGCDSAGTVGN